MTGILKPTINLGCGVDDWGDVRVDVYFQTLTGLRTKLNLRADAHYLPFRDSCFSFCRCWHVIEHAENPSTVIDEIRRTSDGASIRFPVDEGYYKQMMIGCLNLDWNMFLNAYRTFRRHAHKWIIKPSANARVTDRYVEYPRYCGRKGKLFRRILAPRFRFFYEYEVILPSKR